MIKFDINQSLLIGKNTDHVGFNSAVFVQFLIFMQYHIDENTIYSFLLKTIR